MNSDLLTEAGQLLGTVTGLAIVISLVVQNLVKPGLYARYGGEEEAKQNKNYPFTVNIWTAVIGLFFASLGVFGLGGLPVDSAGWFAALTNIVVGGLMAGLGSIGVESVASNIKRRFVS